MRATTRIRAGQRGFSLVELLVVVAILMLVMAGIFEQVSTVQKRYRTEESKLDMTQEAREFLDQIVRDVHQAGYPAQRMYATGVLMNPWQQDSRVAVGLVKFAYDDLWFEADLDGDGQVESVRYKLTPGPSGSCPCTVQRIQASKVNATDPMAQFPSDSTGNTELDGVVNSGGLYPIAGNTQFGPGFAPSNDILYGGLKDARLFDAFDANGNPVPPTDINTNATQLATIRTIAINLNVLVKASRADLQTRMRPALSLSASARINN